MALKKYQAKRKFDETPEPAGRKQNRQHSKRRAFVVQEHHARSHHFDFRLEHEGVLKSWAVPKGPSLDPNDKRLAVEVEDHPLEYGNFQGIIPKGNYGAGRVQIWDRGEWIPHGSASKGFQSGKLKFSLQGERLNGDFALIRMQNDPKNWLLIKEKLDQFELNNKSASKDQSAPAVDIKKLLAAAPKEVLPDFVAPSLATRVEYAPEGSDWLHEVKLDGYRLLARKDRKNVKLITRNELDWTQKAQPIAADLARLSAKTALIDGELVVFDQKGLSNFQLLQSSQEQQSDTELRYLAFDLLHLDGRNLRGLPLVKRKAILESLLDANQLSRVTYNPHSLDHGPASAEGACRDGLEGVISKKVDSKYLSGRIKSWLKIKCDNQQEFVVCGYTLHSSQPNEIGALLLCVSTGRRGFAYSGKVGTGFSDQTRKSLFRLLTPLAVSTSVVSKAPTSRGVVHVRPLHIAQIAFRELTDQGLIRHGVFRGLREDKSAKEVGSEPVKSQVSRKRSARGQEKTGSSLEISNPERVLFPQSGFTKADFAEYLSGVASAMLVDLKRRPLSIVRCPQGIGKTCFFQKHMNESVPEIIKGCEIKSKEGKQERYLLVERRAQLIALAQISAIEIHSWNATVDQLEKPNRFIIDLDPDTNVSNAEVVETAKLLKDALELLDFVSFLRVSGGKGLHVVVPLAPKGSWEEVKDFSKTLVDLLVGQNPALYTSVASKARRKDRIFLDYLRNSRGATSICNYSIRARPDGAVAVPIGWGELRKDMEFNSFQPDEVLRRLRKSTRDPWKGYDAVTQRVDQRVLKQLSKVAAKVAKLR